MLKKSYQIVRRRIPVDGGLQVGRRERRWVGCAGREDGRGLGTGDGSGAVMYQFRDASFRTPTGNVPAFSAIVSHILCRIRVWNRDIGGNRFRPDSGGFGVMGFDPLSSQGNR